MHTAGRFRVRAAFALALALLAHVAIASPFLAELKKAFGPPPYAEKRVQAAFGGIDVDGVRARLDALLEPREPVALAPSLASEDFLRQRFVEGLYPRPVVMTAHWTIAPYERGQTKPWRVLGAFGRADLVLTGAREGPEPALTAAASVESAWTALARGALALLALVGFGALAMRRRLVALAPAAQLGALLLAGAAIVGVAWSAATWVQVSVAPGVLTAAGLAALVIALVRAEDRGRVLLMLREGARSRETLAAAVLALFLSAWLVRVPVSLWDGRSIWLFTAKRLWEHGAFLASEAGDRAALFSHPDYPLFFPAQLAFFAGPGAGFHERAASLAIAALCAAAVALVHDLGRTQLGRWSAFALPLALVVALLRSLAGGYTDGLVTLFLCVEFLALSGGQLALAVLAAACASLTKLEGAVLAALVAGALLACGAARSAGPRKTWWLGLAFVPAIAHLAWTRSLGLDSLLKGGGADAALHAFGERALAALREAPGLFARPGYTGVRSLLWPGLVAWLLVPLVVIKRRDPGARRAGAAWVVALGAAVFGVAAIALLPEDVAWFVDTALDRLLVHAAAFALLALFLALAPGALTGDAEASPGSAASSTPTADAAAGDRSTPATRGAGAG